MFTPLVAHPDLPKLAPFAIALGVLHLLALGICVLGIAASWTQRIPLARAFSWGSILAALAVVGAQFVEIVTHFVFKVGLFLYTLSLGRFFN
jgi:hypothetical protein